MDIDLVDAEQAKSAETLKKPIKQEAVKKGVMDEKTLSNLLSTQSLVCMKILNKSIFLVVLLLVICFVYTFTTYEKLYIVVLWAFNLAKKDGKKL